MTRKTGKRWTDQDGMTCEPCLEQRRRNTDSLNNSNASSPKTTKINKAASLTTTTDCRLPAAHYKRFAQPLQSIVRDNSVSPSSSSVLVFFCSFLFYHSPGSSEVRGRQGWCLRRLTANPGTAEGIEEGCLEISQLPGTDSSCRQPPSSKLFIIFLAIHFLFKFLYSYELTTSPKFHKRLRVTRDIDGRCTIEHALLFLSFFVVP